MNDPMAATNSDFISVVIPTRHRNSSLAECLTRLKPGAQTLSADRYEVIVTDDGTADTAETLIRDHFTWAKWTAGPRRGPAANRNHGVHAASGEWLAFTDDDCLPSPGWLAAFAVAAGHEVQVCEGRTTCEAGIHSIMEEAPINLTGGNLWSCNMMLSRKAFSAVGEFDDRFPHAAVEDLEFHSRIRRAGFRVIFVPDAVIDHPPRRRRTGSSAAMLWEGRVLMRQFDPQTLAGSLPLHVAKVRVSQMLSSRPSIAWLRFTWSMFVEVAAVAAWQHQWHARYAGVVPRPVSSAPVFGKAGTP